MKYIEKSGGVLVSASELAAYAYRRPELCESASNGGFLPLDSLPAAESATEYPSDCAFDDKCGGIPLCVKGTADAVLECGGVLYVLLEESVRRVYSSFNVAYNAALVARGVMCARGAAESLGRESVRLVLTLSSRESGECVSFSKDYTLKSCEKMTRALITRAAVPIAVFAERQSVRIDELKALAFPFESVRQGQQELMLGIMKTVRRGGKLLASAPTGTGKTVAALYPALKALGEGYADKIFYLVGKTVTGRTAHEAMCRFAESAPSLRFVTVRSKERSCPEGFGAEPCRDCRRMRDFELFGERLSYEARRDAALSELLSDTNVFDAETVARCAEKYIICPYELSLDISEYCDVVICDYNYVFDGSLRFRRYFASDTGEKYILLTDECHNLPDRVRSAYSAELDVSEIFKLRELLDGELLGDTELSAAFDAFADVVEAQRRECLESASVVTDGGGEHTVGFFRQSTPPSELVGACERLGRLCRARGRTHVQSATAATVTDDSATAALAVDAVLKHAGAALLAVPKAASVQGEGSVYLAELCDDSFKLSVCCLDPSSVIDSLVSDIHAVIMFSATLEPTDYFADMLGVHDGVLQAQSPFDPENMCLTVFDGVSTKLSDRKKTAREVAQVINTVLASREGHYLVFFPSYAYMKLVARELLKTGDIPAVMQKPTMTAREREKFVLAFKSRRIASLVGLCVLGGVFSEGIDLSGDELIGAIIVGAGLPSLSSRLNLMSEYFESRYGSGRAYAYEYPAINKIEQAAGRVIRTADDRGVVVLIDDRMSSREMISRFPRSWPRAKCTSELRSLSALLERFWSSCDRR